MADRHRVAVSGGSLRSGEGVVVAHQIEQLLTTVEEVAEIPRALRAATEVRRVGDV